jgi:hypothetical protein
MSHRFVEYLTQGRSHPCHICAPTGLTPSPWLGSPLPHLHRDRASFACHRSQALQQRALEKNRQRQLLLQVATPLRTLEHSE